MTLTRSILLSITLVVCGFALTSTSGAYARATSGAPALAVTRCYTNQLTASALSSSGATGHIAREFRLKNESKRTCYLYGYPGAQLLDRQQRPLPTSMRWGQSFMVNLRPHTVLIPSRASAYFALEWAHIPSPGQRCPTAPAIRITPPDAYASLLVKFKTGGIDACGGILNATPVQATKVQI